MASNVVDLINKENGANCDDVNGCDWVKANKIVAFASIVVATLATLSAQYMQQKQLDLAKKYYDMGKQLHDYYMNKILPREQELFEEAFAEPKYEPKYELVGGRSVAAVTRQFKTVLDDALRCSSRYCTGMKSAIVLDYMLSQATARADAQNFGYRSEEARSDAKEDLRWSRRREMVAQGRNLLQTSQSFSNIAANTYGTLGQQTAQAAGSAMGEAFRRLAPNDVYDRPSYMRNQPAPMPSPIHTVARISDPNNGVMGYTTNDVSPSLNYAQPDVSGFSAMGRSDLSGMVLSGTQAMFPQVQPSSAPATSNKKDNPQHVYITNTTAADSVYVTNLGN